MRHIPVLLHEVIESLQLKPNANVIDCTVGDAGHAERILEKTAPNGKLLAIDADPESLLRAKQHLYEYGDRVAYIRENFVHLTDIITKETFGAVNGILMDFGWSSPQFEERGRGFSFQREEEPLDMRYDQVAGVRRKASEILNTESAEELEKIFHEFGEESLSKEIATAIVAARQEKEIKTVGDLVNIILAAYRKKLKTKKDVPWVGGLHPATKVFQALRIAVNDELKATEEALPQAVDILVPGGRLAVITFHSLEDRIVKHFFKSEDGKSVKTITKKPIVAGTGEYESNVKSRSAKLRVVEKL